MRQSFILPHSARKFKGENTNILGNVAVSTVRKYLSKKLGFKKVVTRKKPLITAKHKVQRKEFVKEYGHWGVDEWKRVLFSHEATFLVSFGYCLKVWRSPRANPNDERLCQRGEKYPVGVMVWGYVGFGGVGELVVFEKNVRVNQQIYYALLNDVLETSFEETGCDTFQQDGARCRTTPLILY
ncbi:uncharacterized protein [Palaemon carinicauda]|uniref:uncharacterized protein n=1 Tax=Palaemon carinicauda TaxID=392227 RepID=UPI0035B5A308